MASVDMLSRELSTNQVRRQMSLHSQEWSLLKATEYLEKYKAAIESFPVDMIHEFENEGKDQKELYRLAARICKAAYNYDENKITEVPEDRNMFQDGLIKRVPRYSNALALKMVYAIGNDPKHPTVFIGGRGTKAKEDWITNFIGWEMTIVDNDFPELRVHQGFWNAAIHTYRDVLSLLDQIEGGSEAKIVLCGHSSGGAVASLAGHMLKRYRFNVQVITFGSAAAVSIPRFRDEFITSVILADDPIPCLCYRGAKAILGISAGSSTRLYPAGRLVKLQADGLNLQVAQLHGIDNYKTRLQVSLRSNPLEQTQCYHE
jgi:predicted lipase